MCGEAKLGADGGGGDSLEVAVDEDSVNGGVLAYYWVGQGST